MYETQCQIMSAVPAQSLQEQMFLLTILLTLWSTARTAQCPAALVCKDMLNIWIDIPEESWTPASKL